MKIEIELTDQEVEEIKKAGWPTKQISYNEHLKNHTIRYKTFWKIYEQLIHIQS